MTVYPSSQNEDQYFNDRQYTRKNVTIDAYVRPLRGGKSLVKVLDVSETGFRMESAVILDITADIFLSIPGFQSLEANIIWHRENLYGCTFLVPLHPAILDHVSKIFAEQESLNNSL